MDEVPTIDIDVTADQLATIVEQAVHLSLLGGVVLLTASAAFIGFHLITIATRDGVGRAVREHGHAWVVLVLLAGAAVALGIGLREYGVWFDTI